MSRGKSKSKPKSKDWIKGAVKRPGALRKMNRKRNT